MLSRLFAAVEFYRSIPVPERGQPSTTPRHHGIRYDDGGQNGASQIGEEYSASGNSLSGKNGEKEKLIPMNDKSGFGDF